MYHRNKDESKSVIRLGNNEILKTLMKTLTFVDENPLTFTRYFWKQKFGGVSGR